MNKSVYTRPKGKKRTISVASFESRCPTPDEIETTPDSYQPVFVHRGTECFVTPGNVSQRMIRYLGTNINRLLEPQAGTGNLVDAALGNGFSPSQLTVIERDYTLVEALVSRFYDRNIVVNHTCFLSFASETKDKFDGIVSNPPFKSVVAHIKASIGLLCEGGILVALVPLTFQMEGFEELETLPSDTFAFINVSTKIVRYIKA